jgi:ADP-ribose pyrophosphatase YjhB (NUDIX family)
MECDETLAEGAARECHEEALARVEISSLLAVIDIPESQQVQVFFRARMIDGHFGVGPESLESQLVDEDAIPWQQFAFPSTRYVLQQYLIDRAAGREEIHRTTLSRRLD